MSAPQLKDSAAELARSTADLSAGRLSPVAAAANRASVLAALSAAEAAKTAAYLTPEIDHLIDELVRVFALPVTVYQRETLAEALTHVIDARIAAAHSD